MTVLCRTENLGKKYGSNVVLKGVNIEINSGEIIGLIGENGAGKSTLMKIIAGVEKPSMGKIWVKGQEYAPVSIIDANRHGVGMVFQEQSLVGNLTVAQNIYLGREREFKRFGIVDWGKMNNAAQKALADAGVLNIQPQKKISALDFAERQMVEISKVMNLVTASDSTGSIILLDEATTVLSQTEINLLFSLIRKMANAGNAVVFISHRLDEVLQISDRIIVFKDGEQKITFKKEEATEELLYANMVGSMTSGEYYVTEIQTVPTDEIVLKVEDLSRFGEFNHVSFDLHKGEVLGLCGVEGSGKESLCSVLSGDLEQTAGNIILPGEKKNSIADPYDALKKGILSIPKDRRDEGIIGMLTISENVAASSLDKLSSMKFIINPGVIKDRALYWVDRLKVKCQSINDRMNQLSGGNAQKVVFARAMESDVPIIILNHPTRGVDVGAKKEIYRLVRELTQKGNSIILIGDTLDEVIGLSSRLIVMKDGLKTGEFTCSADNKPSQMDVIQMMM